MLTLHNSLTQRREPFEARRFPEVTIYSCGPTVYARQHLGNMRPYVFADTLRRALELFDFVPTHVINITDVGHLTGDEDAGDDKLEVAARGHRLTAGELAHHFTELFKRDLAKLHVRPPQVWAHATEHIAEQIALIRRLEERGFTYRTVDGIYFDSSRSERLGQLSGLVPSQARAQARVIGTLGKRRATDFALWKFSPERQRRQMEWKSPWGVGFPGWHTECCAMASKYLGTAIDIHTGGVDHMAVHHENEIHQAEAAWCTRHWVRTWMHSEWVMFGGAKLSKSAGGAPSLDDVVARAVDPLAYRLLLLGAHYRSKIHFSWDSLEAAQRALSRLRGQCGAVAPELRGEGPIHEPLFDDFRHAIADDLDTPRAVALLFELLGDSVVRADVKQRTALRMDAVLGLGLATSGDSESVSDPTALDLARARERARAAKDYERADELRRVLWGLGYSVEDTPSGSRLSRHAGAAPPWVRA